MKYSSFIMDCLGKVSTIALSYFGKVKGISKIEDQNQVLTQADIAVGNFLIDRLEKEFPMHNIIDEEKGVIDKGSDFTWVIDPIDGTSNFAANIPIYGIMIGLLERGRSIVGGVSLPFFNEVYIAEKGKGAFFNGKKIQVTNVQDLSAVLLAYGIDGDIKKPEITHRYSSVLAELTNQVRNIRTSHCVYDLMMVAKGSYGGVVDFNSYKIWDHIAPQVIIEEAGGVYKDYDGQILDFTRPLTKIDKYYGVCAASPNLYKKIQEIIQSKLPNKVVN